MDISGAHILVTGASRGIGAELARQLAAKGAVLTLVARGADALGVVAESTGGHPLVCDLTDRTARSDLIARAAAERGPVDVLVNNAGVDLVGPFADMSADDIERIFTLNAIVPAELARQALASMLDRGTGHIVNVSSLAGCAALPGSAVYSASKAALTHFTSGLRADLKGLPIGTTVVEVGVVPDTEMGDSVMSYPPFGNSWKRLKRLGVVCDVSCEKLCRAIVSGIEHDRKHVRLPRRTAPLAMLTEAPRRNTEMLIAGVPRR